VARGALWMSQHQKCVIVAVHLHIHQMEKISALLAFHPKTIFAATEERDLAGGVGLLHRIGIHIAQHQHRARVGILNNGGNEAVAFLEINSSVQGLRFIVSQ